jgi:hypothetical protein
MSENAVPGSPSAAEIQARLDGVTRLLRESPAIDRKSRQALLDLVDELRTALQSGQVDLAEAADLADTAAHLADALHHGHGRERLGSIRDRIEEAVLEAEVEAPLTVGLAHRLMDVLANLGI